MAWTESGLWYATLRDQMRAATTQALAVVWDSTSNKVALGLTTDMVTTPFQTDPATWVNTFECFGTGWATGGIAVSAGNSGGTMAPTFSVVGTAPTTTLKFTYTNNLVVAGTTLTGACGAHIYSTTATSTPKFVSINFAGSFSTVAGTFQITWAGAGVITVTLAA